MDKCPTVHDLHDMVDKDRKPVKVIQRIAAGKYKTFGMFLLKDQNMTAVDVIEGDLIHKGAVAITEAIIKEWVTDETTSTPHTYEHLIESIRKCGLGALAEEIKTILSGPWHRVDTDGVESPKYPMELIDDLAATYSKSLKVPSDEEEFIKDAADKVNVVIQSCNDAEYYAALPRLTEPVKYPSSKPIVVGMFAGRNAAIVRTGKGNEFRKDLKEILRIFPNTNYLLGLGVCMGIKQKFGDVLVGKMIQIEENLKFQNGRLVLRGTRENVKETMKDVFCDDTRGWKRFECTAAAEDSEARTSQVYTGCILSSSLLLNDEGTKQGLEEETQGLIGAEMEGWIAFEDFKSTGRKSITIKGVSDYGDGKKSDDWQLTAAKAAVDYAHFKLESAYLPIVKNIV